MSLIIGIKTHHGIVISADRRISIEYEDNTIRRFAVITDNEQKLFVTENGIAIAYIGSSGIPPISSILENACQRYSNHTPLTTIIEEMKQITKNYKINILLFAYENNIPKILSINSENEKDMSSYPIVYSGATEIVRKIVLLFSFFFLSTPT